MADPRPTAARAGPASADEGTEPSVKDQLIGIIQDQPDDSSRDEILRELAFYRRALRGLADAGAGRVVDTAELRRRLRSWRD
ncbi:MAG: hypothetical protein D6696_08345 [Acidobacteria bacterium]|nr:MAG: hypothetical protein D6696_08345 [Acidobacteriota bacterium]